MALRIILLFFLIFSLGCKDKPFALRKQEQPKKYDFSGVVEVGTPVYNAKIYALEFKNLSKGRVIGETVSERDGTYNLPLTTNYDGPILLSTSGGLYKDLVTDEVVALKPGQELRTAITHINMPEQTNINAWTTMAVARVLADKGFWDKRIANLKDLDRINDDFAHISYFLSGKVNRFVNIRQLNSWDKEAEIFDVEEPKSILHMAHGALSQLAKDYNFLLVESEMAISTIDLLDALVKDLSDRIFDGRDDQGQMVYVGNSKRITLNSLTMRKRLSESMRLYSRLLKDRGKITNEDVSVLESSNNIIESISQETQPELFPYEEKPAAVDKEPPKVNIVFVGEHFGEKHLSILNGNVFIGIQTTDESRIKEIKLLEPQGESIKQDDNVFGPITINQLPQASEAAKACDKEKELLNRLKAEGLNENNLICACFQVSDVFNNTTLELGCFQRQVPKATIISPANDAILSSRKLLGGTIAHAEVVSGLPLAKCTWQVQRSRIINSDEDIVQVGGGNITDNKCIIKDLLDEKVLQDGNYYLVIKAEDIHGRLLDENDDTSFIRFDVCKKTPPLEVFLLDDNEYTSGSYVDIQGKTSLVEKIKYIDFKITGASTDNQTFVATSRASIDRNNGSFYSTLGKDFSEGKYFLNLFVEDIYGNQDILPQRIINIDRTPPKIQTKDVLQKNYLQEGKDYKQIITRSQAPQIAPYGKSEILDWQNSPTIYRWRTRINDKSTSPKYIIKATDENILKEIRYSINDKCASLEMAQNVAELNNDEFIVNIIQDNSNIDLNFDSDKNGFNHKYCLSIWAIDQANNAVNHTVFFRWKVMMPPLGVEVNSPRYNAQLRSDDLINNNDTVSSLFDDEPNPMVLKKNVVLAHAIISNPFSKTVVTRLRFDDNINFTFFKYPHTDWSSHLYYTEATKFNFEVPSLGINIKYFYYDYLKDKIGHEITQSDDKVKIGPNSSVLAKFVLSDDLKLYDIMHDEVNFWRMIGVQSDFSTIKNNPSQIKGLHLIVQDSENEALSNIFKVEYGRDRLVRYRDSFSH